MQPPPFRSVSGLERTSHGALGLALAAEFDSVDLPAAEEAIGCLAARLSLPADATAVDQLVAAGHAFRVALVAAPPRHDGGFDDLRLDRVLAAGRGNVTVCAVAAIEAARWAGVRLGLVASKHGVYVGHPGAEDPLVLSPGESWCVRDARHLDDPDLAWHCPHEAAGMVLGQMRARAQRVGRVDVDLRAAELALDLPLHEGSRERLRGELARVRSRMN